MIELRSVSIRSGGFRIKDVSFTVPTGEYAVLMGPTGRGKTTILEAICGLRPVTAGQILIRGNDVTRLLPADRAIGYVPQDRALFPTMTVKEQLAFALKLRRRSRKSIAQRVEELANLLGIEPLLDRSIRGLSGGESQRVALGRALSFSPSVLLLDEPLSALDEATRHDMQQLLRRIKVSDGVTTLHVTHSHAEAKALADLAFHLEDGRVIEAPELMNGRPDRVQHGVPAVE